MALDTPVPNVFILGAPKCGTTSLYHWLIQHPDVFMSPFKEPRYFCHDLTFRFRYNHIADYLGLFGAAEGYDRIGEASTWYLRSERAPTEIDRFCREAEVEPYLVAMVRDPVEMVHSLHSQLVLMGNEPIEDFAEAYRAEDRRRQGQHLPEDVNPYEGLFYSEVARYGAFLERWFHTFDPDDIHVIVFDDLVDDNPATWKDLCTYLDLEPVDITYRRSNPNTEVRSHWLRDVTRDLPSPAKVVTERLPMTVRLKLRDLVGRLNTVETQRDPLSDEMREIVAEDYADDVAHLESLLDRELDWTRP